jgi:hypothetical protein
MDICVIQPDITLVPKNIIAAFFVTCMFPKTSGELGSKREIGADAVTMERSVEFNGTLQKNTNTLKAGQMILELLGLHKTNYDLAPSLSDNVSDTLSNTPGNLTSQIKEIAKTYK